MPGRNEGFPPLVLKARVVLPNARGRMDHVAIDVKGHRLFLSAIGNGGSEVINIATDKYLRTITGFQETQSEYYDEATNRLFVANGGNGMVDIFNGKNYRKVGTADYKMDADDMRYDPYLNKVAVGFSGQKFVDGHPIKGPGGEGDGAIGWLSPDGKSHGVLVPVDAHPEAYAFEKHGPLVYINVPDHHEIQVDNTVPGKGMARWPDPCGDNCSLALDARGHRLFVACRLPPTLVVFNTHTGEVVASVPKIDGTVDDAFYDVKRSRIYLLSGQGFVDVISKNNFDNYTLDARVPSRIGGRTGLFAPQLNELFVSVSNPKYAAANSTTKKAGFTSNLSSASSIPNELLVYKIH